MKGWAGERRVTMITFGARRRHKKEEKVIKFKARVAKAGDQDPGLGQHRDREARLESVKERGGAGHEESK
jgi:hypothetical protein